MSASASPHVTDSAKEEYYKGAVEPVSEELLRSKGFTTRVQLTESQDGLIVVLVGLPGRGKSFISRKIEAFMNWQCRVTGCFNVGKYRRDVGDAKTSGRADFFDSTNAEASALRREAAVQGLGDVIKFLDSGGEVAIFDATNTTKDRRQLIVDMVHEHKVEREYHVLFVEIICDDPEVLETNYKNKVTNSPDFAGMKLEDAIKDLEERVKKYEDRYETITDDSLSYIKLYNMSSKVLVNRIFGHSAKSLLPFLMGVHIGTRPIWLVRSAKVPPQSNQDAELSEEGHRFTDRLGAFLQRQIRKFHGDIPKKPMRVMSSTIPACVQTAYAALHSVPELQNQAFKQTSSLNPIDRGRHSGYWWVDYSTDKPPWHMMEALDEEFWRMWQEDKLLCRFPGGESYYDVMARVESVLLEIEMSTRPVLCVSHITCLQVLLSYFKSTPLAHAWDMSIPEHTVIEITPTLGGSYKIREVNIDEEVVPDSPPQSRQKRMSSGWRRSPLDPSVMTGSGVINS